MPLEHLQLRIKENTSVKEAVLPYRDPVHFAIAEVDNLNPQYTQELFKSLQKTWNSAAYTMRFPRRTCSGVNTSS